MYCFSYESVKGKLAGRVEGTNHPFREPDADYFDPRLGIGIQITVNPLISLHYSRKKGGIFQNKHVTRKRVGLCFHWIIIIIPALLSIGHPGQS